MFGLKKFYRYNFEFFHSPQIGVYRVMPRTLKRVNAFQAGAALAAHVATAAAEAFLKDHELSPKVDTERCRGCGRCVEICPFDAIQLVPMSGVYTAEVLRYNCVGCGGCVGRCPVTAMDMPYFTNRLLEEIVAGALVRSALRYGQTQLLGICCNWSPFACYNAAGDGPDEHACEFPPDTGDVHRPHQSGADPAGL